MPNNERALHTFIGETNTAHDHLTALLAHADDHFGTAPEAVTWASVETVHHVNELLCDIMEFLGLRCE